MSEHEDFLSIVVAGTAQIGVIEQRGGRIVFGGRVVGLAGEQGGDALAVEDAQFDGSRARRPQRGRTSSPRYERRIPRQVRNPCSGCFRLASTALIRPSVFGPILPAQRRNRSGVHSA